MHLRLASPGRRSSRFGALAIATGAGLLAFAALGTTGPDTDAPTPAARSSATEPTVLGEVIERTSTVPGADPAAAATFDLPTTSSSVTRRSGGTTTTSVLPPATLLPPVSITQDTRPYEPTTTTTESTTTTVDPGTTTTLE